MDSCPPHSPSPQQGLPWAKPFFGPCGLLLVRVGVGLHFRVLPAARSLSPEEVSVAKGIKNYLFPSLSSSHH